MNIGLMDKFESCSTTRSGSNNSIGRELQNRCSSAKVRKLVVKLTTKQKEAVRRVGFGVFIDMKHVVVNTSLIVYLVNQVDTRNNIITIHGESFVLTKEMFEEIMGVYDGGEEILLEGKDENVSFLGALLGSNIHLVISQLCSDLDGDEDKDVDELFVVRFVLAVIGRILCPPSGVYLKLSYVSLLNDVGGIKKKKIGLFTV